MHPDRRHTETVQEYHDELYGLLDRPFDAGLMASFIKVYRSLIPLNGKKLDEEYLSALYRDWQQAVEH